MIQLPCGGGKSFIFAEMAKNTKGEVLVLTHRKELLEQHEELLHDLKNTRISMVLSERNHLGQYHSPKLIIVDECHLSRAKSWEDVINYYDTTTIGFTGTPIRLDGKPLGDIYDDLIQGVQTQWLIDNEYLAPFKYYAPFEVDTEKVNKRAGDYVVSELENIMTDRAIYSDIIKSYQRIANNERSIAYCVSIKHAEETADLFNNNGYKAIAISSHTNPKDRKQIMRKFKDGEIKVLCNVGIISEGISIDEVSCCLLLRPTDSLALYWQQAMRCMRYAQDKTAKIIDCVGNYTRNPLPNSFIEWNLNKSIKKTSRITEEGNFYIRVCPKCFMTFKTADICPYCGEEYPLHEREIKAKETIELKRITEEEAAKISAKKKEMRMQVGRARTYPELAKIAAERGYSRGWIYMMMKARKK